MSDRPNRWKGFTLGALGGLAGVVAMEYYWKAASALAGGDPREQKKDSQEPGPLDDISLVGKHHKEGESSTEAAGRIAYRLVTGKEPQSDETKNTLSYLVHWLQSMIMGGAYGATRPNASFPDIPGGIAFGAAVWLFGDELVVPALGLAGGPTAYPPQLHAHAFGAHMVYGIATAATTRLFDKLT